ncbi:MAG: Aspartyl/glutamyl-tRNA(Asn/Gln) amidotransferase subunit B [Berkelbacteria bacterium GW2011_GWB1_38_5]|uniref:Aspartyl/glutamyl-tRNA(Asn/Gln) amidotransferase subunit B n=2 Tax=Candidatus Berkelbacteria TaxID=1618330 RepID=A0A0G0LI90_9BACT|nr:MAG: Aspartyl/glutamyl-tRNA(Asn/Gln) amidotransferase subunit B [Berkelbacteria bacterium GW2011_GWB1_38_5]KKQ90787.1 MAG: Aspartyl/glutamyl-tRNA(Asn/Gln) amidotransferase subunit B [Berkelbacteria bacterium GW2011_GWA1_39_10]
MSEFKTVIGLEIHVQLKTKSKMFCGCNNNAEEAAPNSLVCPVCMGMPGVLPVANKRAIEWTLKTGLALNSEIAEKSRFDRKHYYYPDLPKNYQISQFDLPFCNGGFLEVETAEGHRKIELKRIHLEEDAGKLIHSGDDSLVDLNRTGTPLMEIVTEPVIESPADAKIFMQELRSILRYLDVSSADMEKGHLRCDANISIAQIDDRHPEQSEGSPADAGSETSSEILRFAQNDIVLGTPVEIKNLNSFRMVEKALIFEEQRQIGLIEEGEKIKKETRGWNDSKGESYSQRSKEVAQDYRYFPEPDLPPFESSAFNIEKIKSELPELPAQKRKRYVDMGIKQSDAEILATDQEMAKYFEGVSKAVTPILAANWIINELKMDGILVVSPEDLGEMLQNLEKGKITGKMAKENLAKLIAGEKPDYTSEVVSEVETAKAIDKVITANPKPVADIKAGKTQAMGFLVGQVMRETQGKANPEIINRLIYEKINC